MLKCTKIKCPICDKVNTSTALSINQINENEIHLTGRYHCYNCGTTYEISTKGETALKIMKEQIFEEEGENE